MNKLEEKTYDLKLTANELNYTLFLIDVAIEAMERGLREKRHLYQPDSQLQTKIMKLVANHPELQTQFSTTPNEKYINQRKYDDRAFRNSRR